MADYTSDEINSTVSGLVQSSVTTPTDALGTRRTDINFGQVQQAVAGVFILYPLAPYYCVYLGVQQVLADVAAESAVIDSLLEAFGSLSRFVLPVTDLTPLFNANSALQALSGAVSVQAPSDITKLAQYQTFASNINAFLAGPAGQAVKQGGAIVPTPAEARSSIPGLMTQLQQAHLALVTSITQFANAISDYQSVNLPALVAAGVVQNASALLLADANSLNAMTPAQRLAALRQPILNVISAQSVVTVMGSSGNTSGFYNVPSPGTVYSDATHLATPATLVGNLGPPYNIQTGINDQLTLTMDGGAPFNVTVPGAVGAQVQGTVTEAAPQEGGSFNGYLISDGVNPNPIYPQGNPANGTIPTPVANNVLHFQLIQPFLTQDVVVTLTTSTVVGTDVERRTAQQICDDINAELATLSITGVLAQPYFYPTPHFNGLMDIVPTVGSSANFTPSVTGASSLTPVQVGDIIVILTGPNADIWTVNSNMGGVVNATASVVTPVPETMRLLQIGPALRAVGMYITDPTLIGAQTSIKILTDTPAAIQGAFTIGWPANATFNGILRVPVDIYNAINQQTTQATASSVILSPTSLPLVSDPSNPFHVVAQRVQSTGALVFTPGSPNTIAITGTSGLEKAGVVVGDTLVLLGQGSTTWTVTVVTDTTVTATSTSTATSMSVATFEIGPTFTITQWQTLSVASGPNKGNYIVQGQGVSPLDIILQQRFTIPHYLDPTTLQPISFSGVLGTEVLTVSSVNQTVLSSVLASGTARPFFWATPPTTAVGTTPYLRIPPPTGGQVPTSGDVLTFYKVGYNTPSQTCIVETVDAGPTGGFILGLSPQISDLPVSWPFPQNQPPYATLQHGHMVDYSVFQDALNVWLAATVNQPAYFQTLSGLVNPLTANTNPTAAQIGAATAGIKALADYLDIADNEADHSMAIPLQATLEEYLVVDVPQVDTVISTYKQKGSDLAISTLISGQFSSFFGLTQQGSSYAGAMQAAMQAVAQNDLPVRKVNRPDATNSRLTATTLSTDSEFNLGDSSEVGLVPDATTDVDKGGQV